MNFVFLTILKHVHRIGSLCTLFLFSLFCPFANTEEVKDLSLLQAISYTLGHQVQIKISDLNVVAQEGVLRHTAGPFDPIIDGVFNYTGFEHIQNAFLGIKTNLPGHETLARLSIQKKARIGTIAELSAQVDQIDDILFYLPPKPTNIGTINFNIEQPLLRNFMRSQDTVNEEAARFLLAAAYYDNLQTVSQQILNTTLQYWEVVAAQDLLNISLRAEERIEKLTDEIRSLIKQDELARSDIQQPLAQIETQKLISLQLRQNLYNAKQILKLTMGDVDISAFDSDQLNVTDRLKYDAFDIKRFLSTTESLIQYATGNRFDIRASMEREEAANVLVIGASNQTLPEVNLNAGVSSSDFRKGHAADPLPNALSLRRPQTNWSIGIIVSVPLYNDDAEGTLLKTRAQKFQAILDTQLLVQTTITDLREAFNDHISISAELEKSNELVKMNADLISNERKKLLEGFSTIFVLLDFENRLTESLSERAVFAKRLAQNIAQIRFLTGTLLRVSNTCIEFIDVTTLPGID